MGRATEPGLVRVGDPPDASAEHYYVDAAKLLDGNLGQTVWLEYQDASGQLCTGVWASEVGAWSVHYTEEEYCRMLEGVSVITDAAGHAVTLRAGDEFVIPAGFVGTWRVLETTRKRFVIYERAVTA